MRALPVRLLLVSFSLGCATSPAATSRTTETPSAPASQVTPPPAPVATTAAFNPVGTYDYTAILPDGSSAPGTMTISGTPGAYTGKIDRQGMGATDITSVRVDGQTLRITTNIAEGEVTLTMNFTGNEFTGNWSIQGAEGALSGKRR
jgi:hypothetical protein